MVLGKDDILLSLIAWLLLWDTGSGGEGAGDTGSEGRGSKGKVRRLEARERGIQGARAEAPGERHAREWGILTVIQFL